MSAAEEEQRRIDLQRAVMEKMSTGMIGSAPTSPDTSVHSPTSPLQSKRPPLPSVQDKLVGVGQQSSSSRAVQTGGQGQTVGIEGKGKSLLRKLSIFGFGKKKDDSGAGSSSAPKNETDTSANRDTVGLNSIVEII
jgi:hypothetical protein